MRTLNYSPAWDLSTIPDSVWSSEHGRRNAARRKRVGLSTGRPARIVTCPCGQWTGTRTEFRTHRCDIIRSAPAAVAWLAENPVNRRAD